jgi:hypothetical protein
MDDKTNVTFIGDPNDDFSGPSTMVMWGHSFPKGKPVLVPQSVADKALTHNHFEVEGHEQEQADAAEIADHDPEVLRNVLDRRGVEYKSNASKAKLAALVAEGGPPTEEELA